jgi:hypothetical protein
MSSRQGWAKPALLHWQQDSGDLFREPFAFGSHLDRRRRAVAIAARYRLSAGDISVPDLMAADGEVGRRPSPASALRTFYRPDWRRQTCSSKPRRKPVSERVENTSHNNDGGTAIQRAGDHLVRGTAQRR